jgi:nucleotide-binding universal stress UspA family protein
MYKNILHATDLSKNHYHVCEQAVKLAKYFKADLYLLHVIEPPFSLQIAQGIGFAEFDHPGNVQEDAQLVMKVLGESFQIPLEKQFVEIGSINTHVINKIQNLQCDLLIIGSHVQHLLPGFMDSTAHTLVNKVKCDILVMQ